MIGFALAAGCPQSGKQFSRITQSLNGSWQEQFPGEISADVNDVILELHVSGKVSDYQISGCEMPCLKGRDIRVTIGIGSSEWPDLSEEENRLLVLKLASEAILKVLELARYKQIEMPSLADFMRLEGVTLAA